MIKDMQPFLQQAWEKAGFKELTEIQKTSDSNYFRRTRRYS